MKTSYAAERQFAKQIIKELEKNREDLPGICSVITLLGNGWDDIEDKLPKLHKYLSNRLNYMYSPFSGRYLGRAKGLGYGSYFIFKPFHHTNRIKLLKKVYKIK